MYGVERTQAQKDRMSKRMSGKNNPMYGRSFYDVWVEKYGKEEAEIREQKRRSRNIIANRKPRKKLTDAQIDYIRKERDRGRSYRKITKSFNSKFNLNVSRWKIMDACKIDL